LDEKTHSLGDAMPQRETKRTQHNEDEQNGRVAFKLGPSCLAKGKAKNGTAHQAWQQSHAKVA